MADRRAQYHTNGAAAYDVDVPALEYTVVRTLREHGLHAATAESCTGGMIAARIIRGMVIERGASWGVCAYCDGVPQKIL